MFSDEENFLSVQNVETKGEISFINALFGITYDIPEFWGIGFRLLAG